MNTEKAGTPANRINLSKKYSTDLIHVDDSARIFIGLVLSNKAGRADSLGVIQEVIKNRGIIELLQPLHGHFQIVIDCWIPYDRIEHIMQLPIVSGTAPPQIMLINKGPALHN